MERRNPKRGGILRVGLDWEVDIIDPPASFGGWNTARVVQQMFESLVEDDLDDEASPYTRLVPALAVHYDISSDGRRYKFHLRKNVRFHDGTPFDAAAVIFNFDRMRRQEAPQFSPIAADYNQMAMQSVKEVRALDEHTVEIILREPFPEFLRCMTQEDAPGSVVFISPTALKSYGNEMIADHAPGQGPSSSRGDSIPVTVVASRYSGTRSIGRDRPIWMGSASSHSPVPMIELKRSSTVKWI